MAEENKEVEPTVRKSNSSSTVIAIVIGVIVICCCLLSACFVGFALLETDEGDTVVEVIDNGDQNENADGSNSNDSDGDSGSDPDRDAGNGSDSGQVSDLDESVTVGDFTVTATGFEKVEDDLRIDLTVTNNSETGEVFSVLLSLGLLNEEDEEFSLDWLNLDDVAVDGTYEPGEKRSGTIIYVSDGTKSEEELYLEVDDFFEDPQYIQVK
ncbi:MAG: hypothetical protein ACOCXP_01650 [Candidatus Dojkabacteria bacterium]